MSGSRQLRSKRKRASPSVSESGLSKSDPTLLYKQPRLVNSSIFSKFDADRAEITKYFDIFDSMHDFCNNGRVHVEKNVIEYRNEISKALTKAIFPDASYKYKNTTKDKKYIEIIEDMCKEKNVPLSDPFFLDKTSTIGESINNLLKEASCGLKIRAIYDNAFNKDIIGKNLLCTLPTFFDSALKPTECNENTDNSTFNHSISNGIIYGHKNIELQVKPGVREINENTIMFKQTFTHTNVNNIPIMQNQTLSSVNRDLHSLSRLLQWYLEDQPEYKGGDNFDPASENNLIINVDKNVKYNAILQCTDIKRAGDAFQIIDMKTRLQDGEYPVLFTSDNMACMRARLLGVPVMLLKIHSQQVAFYDVPYIIKTKLVSPDYKNLIEKKHNEAIYNEIDSIYNEALAISTNAAPYICNNILLNEYLNELMLTPEQICADLIENIYYHFQFTNNDKSKNAKLVEIKLFIKNDINTILSKLNGFINNLKEEAIKAQVRSCITYAASIITEYNRSPRISSTNDNSRLLNILKKLLYNNKGYFKCKELLTLKTSDPRLKYNPIMTFNDYRNKWIRPDEYIMEKCVGKKNIGDSIVYLIKWKNWGWNVAELTWQSTHNIIVGHAKESIINNYEGNVVLCKIQTGDIDVGLDFTNLRTAIAAHGTTIYNKLSSRKIKPEILVGNEVFDALVPVFSSDEIITVEYDDYDVVIPIDSPIEDNDNKDDYGMWAYRIEDDETPDYDVTIPIYSNESPIFRGGMNRSVKIKPNIDPGLKLLFYHAYINPLIANSTNIGDLSLGYIFWKLISVGIVGVPPSNFLSKHTINPEVYKKNSERIAKFLIDRFDELMNIPDIVKKFKLERNNIALELNKYFEEYNLVINGQFNKKYYLLERENDLRAAVSNALNIAVAHQNLPKRNNENPLNISTQPQAIPVTGGKKSTNTKTSAKVKTVTNKTTVNVKTTINANLKTATNVKIATSVKTIANTKETINLKKTTNLKITANVKTNANTKETVNLKTNPNNNILVVHLPSKDKRSKSTK